MSVELWSATLNPQGPNYEQLKHVFPENRVPLQSAGSIKTNLGAEKDVEVYMLDLKALPLNQRSRLLGMVAKKFGVPVYEVEKELNRSGFPIRAADVIVSFSTRAFL